MGDLIAHRQVGTHEEVVVVERDLVELTHRLGHPGPEVGGFRLFDEGTRYLAWQVVCQVRGKETPPTSKEFTFGVIERTWGEGVMRVLQHAISRLVHLHASELADTRIEHYGRCDHEGLPVEHPLPTTFSRHLTHTEVLLYHTQGQMDRVRMVADECGLELEEHEEEHLLSPLPCHREEEDREEEHEP
jgi:hypothetical protein